MKGWIPETETVALTKENIRMVQSDVTVKDGSDIYEVCDFEKIPVTNPVKQALLRGRLEQKKDGWAELSCPGGLTAWVHESDLIYLTIE